MNDVRNDNMPNKAICWKEGHPVLLGNGTDYMCGPVYVKDGEPVIDIHCKGKITVSANDPDFTFIIRNSERKYNHPRIHVGNYTPPDENGNGERIQKAFYRQGMIFKDDDAFYDTEHPDRVCYIPETSNDTYTRKSFLESCNGQEEIAEELYEAVDWQQPETLLEDWFREGEVATCSHCGKMFMSYGVTTCPHCETPLFTVKKYCTRCRETGNKIEEFATLIEAKDAIISYEEENKADGTYSEDFYEIYDIVNEKIVE